MTFSVGLIVPTLNAGGIWPKWLSAVSAQTLQPARRLVVDSASQDQTVAMAFAHGFEVLPIERSSFDHGGTRQYAAEQLAEHDILVYLTQDAVLADSAALERLIAVFENPRVAAVYGRQLPRPGASAIEAHARLFNYPPQSYCVDIAQAQLRGIKGPFLSNSFAAYRMNALRQVGGFPRGLIVSEDMYVGARMLQAGWQLAYCSDAQVYHSHGYTLAAEFRRYFDIGIFHAREQWVRMAFGGATGEGRRFVCSELGYLRRHAPLSLPSAFLRSILKYCAFQAGLREKCLPEVLKPYLSQQKQFWRA